MLKINTVDSRTGDQVAYKDPSLTARARPLRLKITGWHQELSCLYNDVSYTEIAYNESVL